MAKRPSRTREQSEELIERLAAALERLVIAHERWPDDYGRPSPFPTGLIEQAKDALKEARAGDDVR